MSLRGRGCETGMPNRARPRRLPAVEEIDSPLHPRSPQVYSHCKVTGHCGSQVALFRLAGNVCDARVCTFSISCLFTCTHPNCPELSSRGAMSFRAAHLPQVSALRVLGAFQMLDGSPRNKGFSANYSYLTGIFVNGGYRGSCVI